MFRKNILKKTAWTVYDGEIKMPATEDENYPLFLLSIN
jgi:hypothetical protein